MITEDQLEQLAIQCFKVTGWNHVHGAVIAPEAEPSSQPSPTGRRRNSAEREDFRAVVLKGRLAEAVRRVAMPGQVSRRVATSGRVMHEVTKPEHATFRPFRAWNPVGDGTQGVALGCRVMPRLGVSNSQGFLVSCDQIKRRLNP